MSMNVFKTQPHLMPQDAKTVDPSKLTALTPEVVSWMASSRTELVSWLASWLVRHCCWWAFFFH